jgi:4-hydroxymandelate oxidase
MSNTRREVLASACALAGVAAITGTTRSTSASTAPATAPATPAADPVCLEDFEPLARQRMDPGAYAYIAGGAGDEITLRWNREAFDRIKLRPRILIDVSRIDPSIRLFGREMPFPILLAPTAFHRLVHPEGELATAKGAGAAGATLVVSTSATTSIEDIAAVATRPLWFQLYVQSDRAVTKDLIQRAENAGCQVLCVTVDTPVHGVRDREAKARFSLPPGIERMNLKYPRAATTSSTTAPGAKQPYTPQLDSTLTWKDIEWIRSIARVPVVLKGVLSASDADQAARAGAAGIIVSNHGGRDLDTLPATIEALPEVVDKVAGRMAILMDGGIRRGTDVLKAIALGASAVLIGRPYLYGLGAAGAEGVTRVISMLRTELELAMALTGRASIGEIDRSVIWSVH